MRVRVNGLPQLRYIPPPRWGRSGGGGRVVRAHKRELTRLSRQLRRNSTEAEKAIWQRLRNRQLAGFKFRRQQPIGPYIVDFVNFERMFVIELDGGQHAVAREKDLERDHWLQTQGFEVLRYWNNEVLENLEGVLEAIRNKLLPPPPTPPTRGGERRLPV